MIDKNTVIKVTNRDNGSVGYRIPDLNIQRQFQPREAKDVTMDELRKLSYIRGGKYILQNCLILDNGDAVAELLGEVEPEYFYTENEVKQLLLTGSLAQLEDCLDFAPSGVVELVKDLAIKLEINDIAKRQVIMNKTGFNVSKAIEINHETNTVEAEPVVTRRAAPIAVNTNSEQPARRTTAPKSKYKVVSVQSND